jgi:hypothetical protein
LNSFILLYIMLLYIFYENKISVQYEAKMMESMYKLAKFRYECGNYSLTTSYLYFYILVMPTSDKVTSALLSSVM